MSSAGSGNGHRRATATTEVLHHLDDNRSSIKEGAQGEIASVNFENRQRAGRPA